MPAGEAVDDDYVASLLKRDAEANQTRYLTSGLGPLVHRKPNGNAPKPNTRFLRNIIRETDSHNAALKTKEQEDSQARLRELRQVDQGTGGKRRRENARDEARLEKKRRCSDRPDRWATALGGLNKDKRPHRHHTSPENQSSRKEEDNERSKHRDPHRRERSREDRHKRRHTVPEPLSPPHTRSPEHRTKRRPRDLNASDSDPLDDVIGPAPPPRVRARGRGAVSNSAMDARFRPDYDPKADVSLDRDDGDDWDMALEALRDRTKWRQQGAERLKAAGFTDDEVKTWETGGEKEVEDVRWRKKGEGREWDRGKLLDGEGDVTSKAEWARS
ncbi:hypothetical protein LTR36_005624 [Oleoguttula mirabilis]|uniref:Pre-mRNA-splicing factor 38B n=1 Tax=Oleoguttula mirabilis TaxID=1507867 RepID=A0AAV9JF86_9PEZI|nr:hypothetical protein LTR36_005624 [Oleoguttula mirabilis]